MLGRLAAIAVLAAALATAAGCGEDDGVRETPIVGDTVTVYSSLPLSGPLAGVSRDVVRAQKLALAEAGGRAGAYAINFISLDAADRETGRWDPGRVAGNARRAVQDRQTIAYLGELESGASAVSLPILNEGGILQVSPRDTFGGLTEPGGRGEPDKYYPSGVRTFARVVPPDDEQARRLVALMRRQGVRRLVVADDRRLAGATLGDRVSRLAEQDGIAVVDRLRVDRPVGDPEGLAADVARERPDALLFGGAYGPGAVEVLQAASAAVPSLRLYGGDDLALAPELPAKAGDVAARLELLGVDPVPASSDGDFARRFEAAYGERPGRQAVLGFRAMRLVLDAVRRAGEGASSRRRVIEVAQRIAGEPRARFSRYRVDGTRLVRVRPPL